MTHPNIARVYDTGTTAGGRPYFAMERVDGVPIQRYCDRERLELFLDVCGAVQHAHRKGVIHRDLKPSNLLVAEEDGRATVKVIDFGIAKAIEGRRDGASRFTRMGDLLGTGVVDTRSDVYSLGVVLYELLVGELPLSAGAPGGDTPEEIRRRIERFEPPRPSSRLEPATEATAAVAAAQRTRAAALARTLRGDLDWIVLKAVARIRWRREAELARLARLRGDLPAARQRCETALAEAEALGIAADERAWCTLQLAWIALAEGDSAGALELYRSATAELPPEASSAADGPTAPISRPAFLAAAGDLDPAFALLALTAAGGPLPAWSGTNPDLDPLRSDPRYADFEARIVR